MSAETWIDPYKGDTGKRDSDFDLDVIFADLTNIPMPDYLARNSVEAISEAPDVQPVAIYDAVPVDPVTFGKVEVAGTHSPVEIAAEAVHIDPQNLSSSTADEILDSLRGIGVKGYSIIALSVLGVVLSLTSSEVLTGSNNDLVEVNYDLKGVPTDFVPEYNP